MPVQAFHKNPQWPYDPVKTGMRLFSKYKNLPDGYPPEYVQRERELFGKLPDVLEQAWLALGQNTPLAFTMPWPRFLNRSHLVFYWDQVSSWLAGIALADLELDDPPVWVNGDIDDDGKWEKSGDTLAGFLMAMFGYEAACWGLEHSADGIRLLGEEDIAQVKRHFRQLPESLHGWRDIPVVELYANSPDERVALQFMPDGKIWMVYAANNTGSFEEIDEVLSGLGTTHFTGS